MKLTIVVGAALFVLVSMFMNYIFLIDKENMGQYGDIFGLSNALFTGVALIFLIYGVFQQREEIKIAKEDLSRTKDILQEQSIHLKIQDFNNHYFYVCNILTAFISSYELILGTGSILKGYKAFVFKKNQLLRYFKKSTEVISKMQDFEEIKNNILEEMEVDKNIIPAINAELEDIYPILNIIIYLIEYIERNRLHIKEVDMYYLFLISIISNNLKVIFIVYVICNSHLNSDNESIQLLYKIIEEKFFNIQ